MKECPRKQKFSRDEAMQLYQEGYSLHELGRHFGVQWTTVKRAIKRRGGLIRPGVRGIPLRPPVVQIPRDPAILAYVAGLIDGEGSLCVRKGAIQLCITNTNQPALLWVQEAFKVGEVYNYKTMSHLGKKPIYKWNLGTTQDVKLVLEAILPYMIIKKEKAQGVIETCTERIARVGEKFKVLEALRE